MSPIAARRTALFALLGLQLGALSVSSCICDEVLSGQRKIAELAHATAVGEDVTPPLDKLEVGVGAVLVGAPIEVPFTLRATGTLPIAIASATVGSDAELCPQASAEWTLASAAPATLKAGASTPLVVRFAPQSGAPSCAVLTVVTDAVDHPTLRALLTGQGDAAGLCADRGVVDFGDVVIGDTASDTVRLTSCGTRPVTLTTVEQNEQFPPFGFTAPAANLTLAPGDGVDVPVSFAPTLAQRYSVEGGNAGALTLHTDVAGQVFQILLVGVGKAPPQCNLSVVPAVVSFGFVQSGESASQALIARNIGDLPCTLTSLTQRDGNASFSFAAPAFTAGMVLGPFEQLDVTVSFTAPVAEGVQRDALVLVSDDLDAPSTTIPLEATVPSADACIVSVEPSFVDFGGVQLNTMRVREVTVTNVTDNFCFLSGTDLLPTSNAGFVDTSSDFGILLSGASRRLTVGFRPSVPGPATGTLRITVTDAPFNGTDSTIDVQLSALTADPGICVSPRTVDFGDTVGTASRTFDICACGAATEHVSSVSFTTPDSEMAVDAFPPTTLAPGDCATATVRYTPTDDGGDSAVITVVSDDLVEPQIPVTVNGGHEVVPPSAGRFLYFWNIPNAVQGGDVLKFPLQGATTPQPFWGPRNDKQCSGCHSVAPDGKYVAVVEQGGLRFVEAATNAELQLGYTFLNATFFSWNPSVNTTPPYQFAYADDDGDLHKATLFDGEIGPIAGADDASKFDTMPSWGKDGVIAFVRAGAQDGGFGYTGPTDILLVPEDGGAAVPLAGASANAMGNYYPAFSPNGLWIAFTQSPSASSTVSATDAHVRMASAANTGVINPLTALNGADGASSYATWALDSTFLSFSSNRTGGRGNWDIYLSAIDPLTGTDAAANNIVELNTPDFEHAALWSP